MLISMFSDARRYDEHFVEVKILNHLDGCDRGFGVPCGYNRRRWLHAERFIPIDAKFRVENPIHESGHITAGRRITHQWIKYEAICFIRFGAEFVHCIMEHSITCFAAFLASDYAADGLNAYPEDFCFQQEF
jgi:hypothetical protein